MLKILQYIYCTSLYDQGNGRLDSDEESRDHGWDDGSIWLVKVWGYIYDLRGVHMRRRCCPICSFLVYRRGNGTAR